MIAPLRQRNFFLLWSSGFISLIGDWMLDISLPIYIYLLTHSVLATGLMLFAEQIPALIAGSFAGVLVDRWNRRTILLVVNSLMAFALFPLVLVTSIDCVWLVYLVTVVESFLAQFVRPATSAFVPEIVAADQLVQANALTAFSQQAARLIGPALGGLVIGFGGLRGIILGDAISFLLPVALLSAAVVPSRHSEESVRTTRPRGAGMQEWRGGIRLIRQSRILSAVLIILMISTVGEGVFGTLLVVYVSQALHGGAREVGWLMSSQAIGGIIGGALIGMMGKRVTSRWIIGVASILFGVIDLVIFNIPTYFPNILLVLGLFILVGVPGMAINIGIQSLIQQSVPKEYLGRVFGTIYSVLSLMLLIGIGIASTLADRLGAITLLNIQGSGYILAGFLLVVLLTPVHAIATAPFSVEQKH